MDWLNIHRSTLASQEFLGCDPVQRATWLCLLAYCADQENGGIIPGASAWGDRKWQQVVRVTLEEIQSNCPLWDWNGDTLIVWAYPVEKEAEVRRNRENGARGGRPQKPRNNHLVPSGLTQTITQTEPSAPISAKTERKGIGIGIGKEEEDPPKAPQGATLSKFLPPTESEWVAYCSLTWPEWSPVCSAESWAYYEGIGWKTKAGPIKKWQATARTAHGNARDRGYLQPKMSNQTKKDWIMPSPEEY